MRGKYVLSALAAILVAIPTFLAEADAVADPAKSWDKHYTLWLQVSAVIWVFVTVLLLYIIFKFKRKKPDQVGEYIEGNLLLEIMWTVIPAIIIIMLGAQSWALFNEFRNVPAGAYEVNVEGFQYGYEIKYNEGIKTLNELVVPTGPVKLTMTSRDVVHNFSLPDYRIREDMVPGRTTYLWFNAVKPGEHKVWCAELCGTGHYLMMARVVVKSKEDFAAWIAEHKSGAANASPLEQGKTLVEGSGCAACHSLTGEAGAGPSLKGIFGRAVQFEDGASITSDETYIKQSITDPKVKVVKGFQSMMQPYTMTEAELDSVVEYLKTVK